MLTSIKEGKIIDTSLIQDRNLTQISEAFNDFICSKKIEDKSNDIEKTYSSMKKELEELRLMILKNKELINSLNEQNAKLTIQNQELENENNELNRIVHKVFELVKPTQK